MSGRRGRSVAPRAAFDDAFQALHATFSAMLSEIKQPRVMVTSPGDGEGKTVTCVNLARRFTEFGQRVVIVDLDLRHPSAHQALRAHNDFGLSDLVLERRPAEECLQFIPSLGRDTAAGGLYFLGTGPLEANPSSLLSMDRTSKTLDLIAEQADLVLIDAPAVLEVADALVIGHMVSGAILVVEAHRTTVPQLGRAADALRHNQTRLFGVVLNRFDPRDRGYWQPRGPSGDPAGLPS
jgi:capsular exopolysaccharide synthesis family protein